MTDFVFVFAFVVSAATVIFAVAYTDRQTP